MKYEVIQRLRSSWRKKGNFGLIAYQEPTKKYEQPKNTYTWKYGQVHFKNHFHWKIAKNKIAKKVDKNHFVEKNFKNTTTYKIKQ